MREELRTGAFLHICVFFSITATSLCGTKLKKKKKEVPVAELNFGLNFLIWKEAGVCLTSWHFLPDFLRLLCWQFQSAAMKVAVISEPRKQTLTRLFIGTNWNRRCETCM